MSTTFHCLSISEVRQETADAITVRFAVPDALAGSFRFIPGQHLTLRAEVAGEDLRRSYSLCSTPGDKELQIAIKRVAGGRFSNWAADALKAGAMLEVMPRLVPSAGLSIASGECNMPCSPADRGSPRSFRC
ncbi:FAD-binding oxidoreductase [Novosphingobium sp. THN1]|uniref:FAD-binding oxidoreductase n=1 Tax=Novosphingobium sp. THN1 TaxID=1016987 RepID=UPI001F07AA75|nr:FAD-binding oxidoreductase [Novosphingobium sp. THN1]